MTIALITSLVHQNYNLPCVWSATEMMDYARNLEESHRKVTVADFLDPPADVVLTADECCQV